jgi:hypothetical protein
MRRGGMRVGRGWGGRLGGKVVGGTLVALAALVGMCFAGVAAVTDYVQHRAFTAAVACPSPGYGDDDCLRSVTATVTGVTEVGGKASDYSLAVRTASGRSTLTFSQDNSVLSHAADGSTVTVVFWRGHAVAVSDGGARVPTEADPARAFGQALGYLLLAFGFGSYAALVVYVQLRTLRGVRQPGGPAATFALITLIFGPLVPLIGGMALVSSPQSLRDILLAALIALAVVLALSGWAAVSVRRRLRRAAAVRPHGPHRPKPPRTPVERDLTEKRGKLDKQGTVEKRGKARPQAPAVPTGPYVPAVESTRVFGWVITLLVVGVLFGVLLTLVDGLPARAYRTAPACAGTTATATCRGTIPMVVNGVRTPTGGESVDVSLTNSDGSVNTWAQFDVGPLSRRAPTLQQAGTVLQVRVWKRRILAVAVDGSWDWAQGDPPDDLAASIALATTSALLLALNRARVRLRWAGLAEATDPGRRRRFWTVLRDDLLQLAGTACAVLLMAVGFGWAGLLLAASLGWSLWSVRQAGIGRTEADRPAPARPTGTQA